MLPRLVILPAKKDRKKYIEKTARELSVKPFNIFTVSPEDGTISIDQMRQLSPLFLTQSPDTRLIVVDSFDLATVEAQNSLLKLLEEKTVQNLFLFFADQPEGIIPTVRSRTQVIYPGGRTGISDEGQEDTERLLADIAAGGSLAFLNNDGHLLKTKEDVLKRVDGFIRHYRKLLVHKPDSVHVRILKKLLSVRKEVQSFNVNPQFAYDILLIFISEIASMK